MYQEEGEEQSVTKAEKREKKRDNSTKMIIDGRGIFNILRIQNERGQSKKNRKVN